MKQVVIFMIRMYQLTLSPFLRSMVGSKFCRYEESCSHYAIRQVREKGAVRGLALGLKRLLSCHPFATIH